MDFFVGFDSFVYILVNKDYFKNTASRTDARETKRPLLATRAARSAAVWAFHQGQYTPDLISFISMYLCCMDSLGFGLTLMCFVGL